MVVVCGMGNGSDMHRVGKDLGGKGELYLEKHGGWGHRLTLGSKSQSQAAGLGTGLLPDIYLRRCWELPTPTHKNTNIIPPWNPLSLTSKSRTNPPYPVWNYPSILSISSSLLLKAFIANIRGLALPIKDLPVTISF